MITPPIFQINGNTAPPKTRKAEETIAYMVKQYVDSGEIEISGLNCTSMTPDLRSGCWAFARKNSWRFILFAAAFSNAG